MKKNLLLILLILMSTGIYAQRVNEIIAPSPTVAELGKYGMVPVGLFSGTAQYDIPLYELKTKNLSIPISLSYSSNGLVVDQVSSWVGHSWSLNAGGVITRSVRGLPDDPSYSFSYPEGVDGNSNTLLTFLETERHVNDDVEPDIYAFNFMGYQGKFYIETDKKVYLTPYQSLKIEVDANKNFIIWGPDGIKYSFEKKETYWCSANYHNYTNFTSAWYLTKIEHPAGDIINLNYSGGESIDYNSGISETIIRRTYPNSGVWDNPAVDPPDGGIRASVSSTLSSHLVSITTNGSGSIDFHSSKGRNDLVDDYKLDLMTIYNNGHATIKSFSFNYIFPEASVLYDPPFGSITYTLLAAHTTELKYRMYLNQITINNLQENNNQIFSFEYNNLNDLPCRLSLAQDYFGYFNGITNNTHFIPSDKIPPYNLPQFPGITGNRHPNGEHSINGTLKKIIYPTGGNTQIYYESHQSTQGEIGGCRVQKTESYDSNTSVPNVKEYKYADGILHGLPSYFRTYDNTTYNSYCQACVAHYNSITSSSLYSIFNNGQYPIVYCSVNVSDGINSQNGETRYGFTLARDMPAMNIFVPGMGIVYPLPEGNEGWSNGTKVSEETLKKLNNGTFVTIKNVNFLYPYPEVIRTTSCLAMGINDIENPTCRILGANERLSAYYLVGKYTLTSEWRPLTGIRTTIYDSNGQNPVEKSIIYTYDNASHFQVTKEETTDSKGINQIKTFKYPSDFPSTTITNSCEIERQACLAAAIAKRDQALAQCNQISEASAKATCTSFHTSIYNYDVAQCESNFANCNSIPASDQQVVTEMRNKNMINPVIEAQTLQLKDNVTTLTGGTINKYKKENGLIVPSDTYVLELNSPSSDLTQSSFNSSESLIFQSGYHKNLTYDKYDTKGNILQYHKSDNINTAFLWSYNGSMPVAKGDNVTYDILNAAVVAAGAINMETFWSGFNNIATDASQQAAWKTFNAALRNNASLINAQVTTYTYIPLIGLTSQTDPNCLTTYYEYDSFGRLKLLKDKDGNILKSNNYHYKE